MRKPASLVAANPIKRIQMMKLSTRLSLVVVLFLVTVAAAAVSRTVGTCDSIWGCGVLKTTCTSAGYTYKSEVRDGSRGSCTDESTKSGADSSTASCTGKVCTCSGVAACNQLSAACED